MCGLKFFYYYFSNWETKVNLTNLKHEFCTVRQNRRKLALLLKTPETEWRDIKLRRRGRLPSPVS